MYTCTCTLHFYSSCLIPTDTGSGYRQPKARLGRKHVRPWKWMPFTNLARKVGVIYNLYNYIIVSFINRFTDTRYYRQLKLPIPIPVPIPIVQYL